MLVHIDWRGDHDAEREQEFAELALAAGAEIIAETSVRIREPDPRHLLGSGRVEEIHAELEHHDIQVVLVDHALSPAQERNLERAWKTRVLSRTGLILDIFAQRARSFEGRCKWSWRSSSICPPVWYGAGRTWSGRRAVSACAARVRPSWKPTDGC